MLFYSHPFDSKNETILIDSILRHEVCSSLFSVHSRTNLSQSTLCFPDKEKSNVSDEAIDFIKNLITERTQRLGFNGSDEVKNHPWLRNIAWGNVRSVKPPFIPEGTETVILFEREENEENECRGNSRSSSEGQNFGFQRSLYPQSIRTDNKYLVGNNLLFAGYYFSAPRSIEESAKHGTASPRSTASELHANTITGHPASVAQEDTPIHSDPDPEDMHGAPLPNTKMEVVSIYGLDSNIEPDPEDQGSTPWHSSVLSSNPVTSLQGAQSASENENISKGGMCSIECSSTTQGDLISHMKNDMLDVASALECALVESLSSIVEQLAFKKSVNVRTRSYISPKEPTPPDGGGAQGTSHIPRLLGVLGDNTESRKLLVEALQKLTEALECPQNDTAPKNPSFPSFVPRDSEYNVVSQESAKVPVPTTGLSLQVTYSHPNNEASEVKLAARPESAAIFEECLGNITNGGHVRPESGDLSHFSIDSVSCDGRSRYQIDQASCSSLPPMHPTHYKYSTIRKFIDYIKPKRGTDRYSIAGDGISPRKRQPSSLRFLSSGFGGLRSFVKIRSVSSTPQI